MEVDYASNGKANTGVALGATGLGLGVLGILGNHLFGVNNVQPNNCSGYVTREEMRMTQELAVKDAQIALLTSEQNTEIKIADVYERIMTRVNADAKAQAERNEMQSVANATVSAALANLQRIAAEITTIHVPKRVICPEPMDRYNTWVAPTAAEETPTA